MGWNWIQVRGLYDIGLINVHFSKSTIILSQTFFNESQIRNTNGKHRKHTRVWHTSTYKGQINQWTLIYTKTVIKRDFKH